MGQKGSKAALASCFGWLLPSQTHAPRGREPAAAPHQDQPLAPGAPQAQGVDHLVGVANAVAPPRELGRLMSLVQVPAHGRDAYELVGELGSSAQGQQGCLKLMRHRRSKELVTVKFVKRSADALLDKNVEREILNHRRLVHPNILAFREVFATDDELAIVVEYASAGQLADRCAGQRLSEGAARALFAQLLAGLAYCHARGVHHRDLRTELLLLSGSVFEPTLKIGGFGFSKSAAMDSMAKTAVGARAYIAPEVLLSRGSYDAAGVDVWATGVVLYHMLTGRLPFCHDTNAEGVLDHSMMQRILKGQYYLPGDVALSFAAQDLLARILTPDPAKRIGLAKMRRHPWLRDAPSVLDVTHAAADGAAPADDGGVGDAQSEEGIQQVLRRARERRLKRISSSSSHASVQAQQSGAVPRSISVGAGTVASTPKK